MTLTIELSPCQNHPMSFTRMHPVHLVVAIAIGAGSFTACASSDTPGPDDIVPARQCADGDADNPTLRQIYDGAAELLANTAIAGGSSEVEVEAIRQGNSYDSAVAILPPEQSAEQEQFAANIPHGGYARYVRAICESEESFQGVPTITSTPWAAALDGMMTCTVILSLPASQRDSYASSTKEGTLSPGVSDALVTYAFTKATAAREHLCPQ